MKIKMLDKLIILSNNNKNINIENEINNNNQIISKNSSISNYNESKHLINIESKIYLENDNNNNIDNNIQQNNNKNKTEINIKTPKILSFFSKLLFIISYENSTESKSSSSKLIFLFSSSNNKGPISP